MAETIRILILEDNPPDADLVQFELEEAGFLFASKVVMTEEDFVRELREFSPDLILSDYDLPKYNGASALAEARRTCPDTPFILVTGAITEDRAIDILTQGAKDYVLKNRLRQRLVPAVRRALAERDAEKLAKQMAIIAEIGRVVSSTFDIGTVYERFASITRNLIPFDTINVNLIDATKKRYRIVYSSGPNPPERAAGFDFPIAGTMVEYAMRRRKAMTFNASDADEMARLFPRLTITFSIRAGFHSNMMIPLFSNDVMIGVLHFRARKQNAYSEADLPIAEQIGTQIAGAIANAQLFNDLTKTEESLQESEEKYRTLFNNERAAICIFDLESLRIVDANEAHARLYGYSRDELLAGMKAIDLSAEREESMRSVRSIHEGGNLFVPLRWHRKKDGTAFPVEIVGGPYQWKGHRMMLAIVFDITERKQAEEILRQNQKAAERLANEMATIAEIGRVVGATLDINTVYERFASIARKLIPFDTLGVNLIDATKNLLHVPYFFDSENPGPSIRPDRTVAGTMTEYVMRRRKAMIFNASTREDMASRYPEITKTLSIDSGYHSSMMIPLFSNDVMIGVLHFRAKNQNTYGEGDLRLAQRIGEQIAGAIANAQLFNELTRTEKIREKLQAQLLQSQKMESVGRLAGGVAHDFNNMLGVILGHAEMALEQVDRTQLLYSDLQAIQQAANRSKELTRQLLAFARKQTVSPKVLNVNDTIEGMLKMLQRLIGEDIRLNWLPGKDLWSVNIDPSQIDQILANLCVNARDAITGVGKVTIETGNVCIDEVYCADRVGCTPGDYFLLAVSDNGCGMDKDTLGNLFEPFFTTKELGKGTGLGLATVYGIVKQNNGFIDVYSEPAQGTTFKLYLPRHMGKAERTSTESLQGSFILGQETVLLVEDEPEILSMAKRMLEKQGYHVLAAGMPGEAIQMAKGHNGEIHLLMTDVVMPEMNGRELAKKVLLLYPNIKRLFMSGYTADVIANQGILDEDVHFIQKPFSVKDLAAKVREALDRK